VKKFLVVEDDLVNPTILMDFFAANGYPTVDASSGPEGIERFEATAPDLLLVDVQLPRQNGFEVVREIKALPADVATPVLIMSAVYSDPDQSHRVSELGTLTDGYLSKPFALGRPLTRVRPLLGEAA
jgi:CheY-like chemotaxis protein